MERLIITLNDLAEKHGMSIDEIDNYITEHKKIEEELGIDLITLFNNKWLKSKIKCYLKRHTPKQPTICYVLKKENIYVDLRQDGYKFIKDKTHATHFTENDISLIKNISEFEIEKVITGRKIENKIKKTKNGCILKQFIYKK